jgi:dTDP-4-amino-4,6-dideoxygalactose transaminase
MSRVPTKDYARQYRPLWGELGPELERVIFAEEPILGASVGRFEAHLAGYHEVEHAVGVGSGTDAIILAVRGLGLGPGDEVVTGAHTFAGVVSALVQAGVEPRLADADPVTGSLDVEQVARALSPRTRAVLAVHMYGLPVELAALTALCRERGLFLIEDVAQAHGARYAGRPVGSFGDAATLSFHPSKNLGAFGDGGAVLTSSAALAASLRVARNLGKESKYRMSMVAPNSKLDTLQAAILDVKLRHLDRWVARRRALATRYRERLAGLDDLVLPAEPAPAQHAYHLFVVRTARRDALRAHLADRDIQTGIHYPVPVVEQPALASRFAGARYPVAAELARTVVSLPLSQELDDDEVDRVAAEVRHFFGAGRRS